MSTQTMELEEIEQENKQAWDTLYGQTDELIWGNEPLEFVRTALSAISPRMPENPVLLDAATGEGRNLPILFEFSRNVVACDSSSHALRKLRLRFPEQVQTEECDLARTVFHPNSFDAILACDVIETLPNLGDVLAELHRILKPGGFLICNVPDMQDGIAGQNMERIDETEFMYQNQYFFRFQDKSDFVQFLSETGLVLERNFTATWMEEAHPQYREEAHSHTSQIIIAQKVDHRW
ncbi:MAG: class I SAM-dependent methyltransferase [Planctomycetia bacterium]|nr:class I SAM-dependent methyltransferase [Planctomycetia bacterium]